jgi:ABC-type glycerol-3-phosphate transport system permease component
MRRSTGEIIALILGCAILAILVLMPFWWVVSSSIKDPDEIIARLPTLLIPESFTLQHYQHLLASSDFPRFLANSLIVSAFSMAVTVLLAILAGYAFFRLKFPGQRTLYRAILIAYAFPGIVLLVPIYGMMAAAGIIDTLGALVIVNVTFALPFAIWMMRAFLVTVPVELEEAAKIDGASTWTILWRVVVPLISPGIASVAIFAFISSWTEYVFASVLIQSAAHRTIPTGFAGLIGQYQIDWGLMLAGATLAALPVVALFLFIGRYFIAGLTEGAVK